MGKVMKGCDEFDNIWNRRVGPSSEADLPLPSYHSIQPTMTAYEHYRDEFLCPITGSKSDLYDCSLIPYDSEDVSPMSVSPILLGFLLFHLSAMYIDRMSGMDIWATTRRPSLLPALS